MEFNDLVFNLGFSLGSTTELSFNTLILENSIGEEERIVRWLSPLLSFNLSKLIVSKTELEYVKNFFLATDGNVTGFRFLDETDFRATAVPLDTIYGSSTQGILLPTDLSNTQFQFYKIYRVGNGVHYRIITRPEFNSIEVFDDDGEKLENWIFLDKGILSFPEPIRGSLTTTFQFYVPVTFSSPRLGYRLYRDNKSKLQGYTIENFTLEEIKETASNLIDEVADLPEWQLNKYINSVTSIVDSSEVIDLVSGFSKRTARYEAAKGAYLTDRIKLNRQSLDYLIAFWRCAKAQGVSFPISDRTFKNEPVKARFDQDTLAIEISSKNIFYSNAIKLIEAVNAENITFGFFVANLPTTYTSNSILDIAGRIIPSNSSDPSLVTLTFKFDFGTETPISLNPDSEGYFFLRFVTRSDLGFSESGKFEVTESIQNSILYSVDIVTASEQEDAFSMSATTEAYSGGEVTISGKAPPAAIVNLSIPEFNINVDLIADALNNWYYIFNIPETQGTITVIATATTEGFAPASQVINILKLIFDPLVNFEQFQYN